MYCRFKKLSINIRLTYNYTYTINTLIIHIIFISNCTYIIKIIFFSIRCIGVITLRANIKRSYEQMWKKTPGLCKKVSQSPKPNRTAKNYFVRFVVLFARKRRSQPRYKYLPGKISDVRFIYFEKILCLLHKL